ncbi:uncharacterized protein [Zea mays]|uniref:uncharacterized protein isoform X2 n=1 Tax=Zea mays TaxID=4577 RepID=UPI0004DE998E|nr:uncharacterized protein LOC103651661 isoform X2 [Zea mays]|eukprot:XP_008675572.1 uncharacterized protein LOC103651661 isoform X2 [Zea mays]
METQAWVVVGTRSHTELDATARRRKRRRWSSPPYAQVVQGLAQGARGRHPTRQHPGSRFLEGLRRGLSLDVQPRRPLLPLPHVVDRLQPRWRTWAAQDPNLQGLCRWEYHRDLGANLDNDLLVLKKSH